MYLNRVKVVIGVVLLIVFAGNLWAEFKLDNRIYQDGPFTKFSDWIPKRLHDVEPLFLEDFYELYGLKLLYDENELRRNIYFLKIALKKRFRHPKNALCLTQSEPEYHKYRLLLFMQVNLAIMRSYMRIASLYDKRMLYFYNLDFADDLEVSFAVAEGFYKEALPYWQEAKKFALEADQHPFEIDLPAMESARFSIATGEEDFAYIIGQHLAKLAAKQSEVKTFLDREGRPRPVKVWMNEASDPKMEKDLEDKYRRELKSMEKFPNFRVFDPETEKSLD